MSHLERLPSGIIIPNPGGTHWHECWRVHHECAVAEIEAYRAVMSKFHCETDGGVNDPAGLQFVFERVQAGVIRRERRIAELESRIEGKVEP